MVFALHKPTVSRAYAVLFILPFESAVPKLLHEWAWNQSTERVRVLLFVFFVKYVVFLVINSGAS